MLFTKRSNLLLISLLATLLFSACVSLTVYEPILENSFTNETNFSGYQSDYQVSWITTVDQNNLYIRVETENQLSKLKILRKGFFVYFSTSGKKNKDNYIHYPLEQKSKAGNLGINTKDNSRRNRGTRVPTTAFIKALKPNAELVKGSKKESFHVKIDTSRFKINISEDSNTMLRYTIKIPFKEIVDNLEELNGMSIGLVSGAFDVPVNSRPMPSQNPNNMPGSQGRMPGAANGGMRNTQGSSYNAMADPIRIWFKLDNVIKIENN